MTDASINDPFHRQLAIIVRDKLTQRIGGLASGDAIRVQDEVITTAEKYAAKVAYIQALNDVLNWCQEIENPKAAEQQASE